ncbi:hypothetical protein ACFL2K_03005 [Candidatus Margulisiibacteriota bacterium]
MLAEKHQLYYKHKKKKKSTITKRLNVNLPLELHKGLKKNSAEKGLPITEIVIEAIENKLNIYKPKKYKTTSEVFGILHYSKKKPVSDKEIQKGLDNYYKANFR